MLGTLAAGVWHTSLICSPTAAIRSKQCRPAYQPHWSSAATQYHTLPHCHTSTELVLDFLKAEASQYYQWLIVQLNTRGCLSICLSHRFKSTVLSCFLQIPNSSQRESNGFISFKICPKLLEPSMSFHKLPESSMSFHNLPEPFISYCKLPLV